MKSNYTRIIANLVFAGAVATGAFLPQGSTLPADGQLPREMPAYSRYMPDILQDKSIAILSVASAAPETMPTLEEYLGKLVCTGCERRCPLTALKCARGQVYLEKATSAYREMVAKTSVPADKNVQGKTQTEKPVQTNAPVEQTAVQGVPAAFQSEQKTGVVETTMQYLPLAGLVVGGVYFTVGNRQKMNK